MHWLGNYKSLQGYATLELDMSKAYDWIEWGYLKTLMMHMGFHPQCVESIMYEQSIRLDCVALIMRYVESVMYAFRVNDSITIPISSGRELQQGLTALLAQFQQDSMI